MYRNLVNEERKARKDYACDWCKANIKKGERYNYQKFIFDGDFYEWKSHLACERVAYAIWDYVDPDEGMSSDEFHDGCGDVCRAFICPDCPEWDGEYSDCKKDEPYCIDRMDSFFLTHELYCSRDGYRQVWKCRLKGGRKNDCADNSSGADQPGTGASDQHVCRNNQYRG